MKMLMEKPTEKPMKLTTCRNNCALSREIISLVLLAALMTALFSCAPGEAQPQDISQPHTSADGLTDDDGADMDTDFGYSEVIVSPVDSFEEEEPEAMLERGPDGILIGSMVFRAPVMLVGNFQDGETEGNVINVRSEPSTDSIIEGQINYRKVVEATEVVDGWYRVTVLSNQQSEVLSGFIRSDLLKEYSEEGTHNRTQIGSAVFDEPVLLIGALNVVNVRSGPGTEHPLVTTIGMGQEAEAVEVVDGWYHVTIFPGMFTGYIDSELLVAHVENRQFFANTREDSIEVRDSGGRTVTRDSKLVDVRAALPDIEYYMIFATPDNFTGRTLYSRDVCILQSGTVEKLAKAQELFAQDGYTIKIYDAYRPSSVSGILSGIITDPRYVAPAGVSIHNRAAAVDMTLVDSDGNELEMPSPMHTFDSTSHRDSSVMSAEAKANMDYMTGIMRQSGFTTVSSEWWHFSDSEASKYPPLDFTFNEFTFYSVDS